MNRVYEFDPKKERFAVEIGEPNKLERLDKIPRPRTNEKVGCVINWNVFDWVKSFDGYGEIEQDGKQMKPPIAAFPSMSFKDGKLVFGDLPAAQVGVGIAMTLVLDGKVNIINVPKMATSKNFRTACGQKANGNILFVTVANMTTQELAEHMSKLGCVNAFQGDSGGSTGMFVDGKLHDQGRAIAAALVAYKRKLIAIDDGHGMATAGKRTPVFTDGTNGETGQPWMHENEFNRVVAQKLKTGLERCGFDTLLVAPTDDDTPLEVRTETANKAKADFYISVHANALAGVWGPQNGISTYHYLGSEKSRTAAVLIHRQLAKGTKLKDRGVLTNDFHVLRETGMPSVLVECAFMDNDKEARLLMTDGYREECADEICKGICEFFGVVYVPAVAVGLTIPEMVECLVVAGIVTESQKWVQKAIEDKDIYWLIQKMAEHVKKGGKAK